MDTIWYYNKEKEICPERKLFKRDSKGSILLKNAFLLKLEITLIDENLVFKRIDIAQIRDLCYSQRKRKGYVLCREEPKRSDIRSKQREAGSGRREAGLN